MNLEIKTFTINSFVTGFLTFFVFYACFAFAAYESNPLEWSQKIRFYFAVSTVVAVLMITGITWHHVLKYLLQDKEPL